MSGASEELVLSPIGVIRSPHRAARGTPIQSIYATDFEGEVVLEPRFSSALADIDGFERIWLIYCFDRARPFRPHVTPYRDDRKRGLFATRAPSRPNPIGISVVRLLAREDNVLRICDLDVLDGTPVLDLKPYVPEFDAFADSRAGWLDSGETRRRHADNRFHSEE